MKNNHLMAHDSTALLEYHRKILASHRCVVDEYDYERIAPKVTAIREIGEKEKRDISLYDLASRRFLLKGDKHLALLGYEKESVDLEDMGGYHSLVHRDDLTFLLDTEIRAYGFLAKLPAGEKKEHKLVYDYRVRGVEGEYVRFLHQLFIFELDRENKSWIIAVISDVISKYPDSASPVRFVLNTKTNRVCLFNEEVGVKKEILTRREKEIVSLISQGLSSNEIAERLFLSASTVNNHRENIISKTRSRNIVQAITYMKAIGIA